jgi:large subunit ribosomal protein L24
MERKFNTQQKLHIRKGDTVKVLSGDGINIITKHQKPSAGKPEGGIKKIEGGVHISNLMLIDPASGKPTRTGRKLDEKGKLQRYSKKTGELIK